MAHILSIAIKYLMADHDLDHLLDRDRLARRGSHGMAHTLPISIACRGPHQPDCDYIFDSRSRSRSPPLSRFPSWSTDRQRNLSRVNNSISRTRILRSSYFNPISEVQILSDLIFRFCLTIPVDSSDHLWDRRWQPSTNSDVTGAPSLLVSQINCSL